MIRDISKHLHYSIMPPKTRISISISVELLKWIEKKIAEGVYGSKSHAVSRALILLKRAQEG